MSKSYSVPSVQERDGAGANMGPERETDTALRPTEQPGQDIAVLSRNDVVGIVEAVCQRMIGPRVTALSDRRRRRRHREEEFQEHPMERLDQLVRSCIEIKEATHISQYFGRKLFKDVFGISRDEDFADHKTASPEQVKAFVDDTANGPDPEDLHFDMNGLCSNAWNRRVIAALAEKFEEKRRSRPKHLRIPERPVEYVEELLTERFKRCKGHWTDRQAQFTDTGIKETQEEVEIRVNKAKTVELRNARHATRRRNVGASYHEQSACADNAAEIPKAHADLGFQDRGWGAIG
jgi:hypothetical protein